MCKLSVGDIISYTSSDDTIHIGEITGVVNITKSELEQHQEIVRQGGKYLYHCIYYQGLRGYTYDCWMSNVIVLSNRQFVNAPLHKRFWDFKEQYNKELKAEAQSKTKEEEISRLGLKDIADGSKVKVVFFDRKPRTIKYVDSARDVIDHQLTRGSALDIIHLISGINQFSRIPSHRIKEIVVLTKDRPPQPPPTGGQETREQVREQIKVSRVLAPGDQPTPTTDEQVAEPPAPVEQPPAVEEKKPDPPPKKITRFEIPWYEVEQGYSDIFWEHFRKFVPHPIHAQNKRKYKLIIRGVPGGVKEAVFLDYLRYPDNIVVRLQVDGNGTVDTALGDFSEILLEEGQ